MRILVIGSAGDAKQRVAETIRRALGEQGIRAEIISEEVRTEPALRKLETSRVLIFLGQPGDRPHSAVPAAPPGY